MIRYIGATSAPLEKRLYGHIHGIGAGKGRKNLWILEMRPLIPEIVPYATGLSFEQARDLEVFVISELKNAGYDLLNHTDKRLTERGHWFGDGNKTSLSQDERMAARIQKDFKKALEQEQRMLSHRLNTIESYGSTHTHISEPNRNPNLD